MLTLISLITVEVGINVEAGVNRRLENIYEINKRGGWNFSKSVSVGPTFMREMRVSMHCYNAFDLKLLHSLNLAQ